MRVYLRKGIKPRVLNGHPWVYDNEIEREIGEKSADGDIVDVYYGSSRIGKQGGTADGKGAGGSARAVGCPLAVGADWHLYAA